ncbi:tribbles homolog 1 isoform X1 [Crotalus tigris]|uniref:tribbles homolog 1 isoform X1 n=2 Tax=Crotalus tigris TaxID=88082 RepID=UPI00192FA32A|nr:tribbles homolog 1 isoform X1 [Crotalus tigris]
MSRQLEPRSPAALLHSPAAAPRCRSAPSKRLLLHDAAEEAPAAAKCARLAVDYSSAAPQDCLSAPGSPCAPAPPAPGGQGSPSSAQGPSLIAGYLLLPLLDREHVSRALDINTGRELRCKVFPLKHYQDKIKPYIQLPSHRNITGIVEVILGDTKAYVFFDKDFGDMHSYVRSCKRLPEQEAARLFKQIVSAVAHCHQSAIVLGDLKLRKFVFSNEERRQLRLESLEDTHIMKGEDDALSDKHGCPAYVSPEILNTTGTYSGKSADVWSLGVMLYTLLVGRYPFHDSDPTALFSKIRRGQFCIPDQVSPKARCLIRSLLRREPSERLTAPEILLHPWFDAVLESGYADQDVRISDQVVPEQLKEDDDMSLFFC